MKTPTHRTSFTIVVALFGVCLTMGQTLRTIATHEEPTKELAALLSVQSDRLDEAAEKLDVEVVRDGDDILMFGRDIYNMAWFDQCLRGIDAITAMMRKGKSSFKLGELGAEDKAAVQQLMLGGYMGDSAGPALASDDSQVMLQKRFRIGLEANGRKMNVFSKPAGMDESGKDWPKFTKLDFEKFKKDDLPVLQKTKHDVNLLRFAHSKVTVDSDRRTAAVLKLVEIIQDRLKAQIKAYTQKRGDMVKAAGGAKDPAVGQDARSLEEGDRAYLAISLKQLGFGNDTDIARYLDGAKVTMVDPGVSMSIGFRMGAARTVGMPVEIHRGK